MHMSPLMADGSVHGILEFHKSKKKTYFINPIKSKSHFHYVIILKNTPRPEIHPSTHGATMVGVSS